jgi:hypothetical protein
LCTGTVVSFRNKIFLEMKKLLFYVASVDEKKYCPVDFCSSF